LNNDFDRNMQRKLMSRPLASIAGWWFFAALLLPLVFFSETLLLLYETVSDLSTWMMAVWWALACGALVFFLGFPITLVNKSIGVFLLSSFVTLSLTALKLAYLEPFVALSEVAKVSGILAFFAIVWISLTRLNISTKGPSPFLVISVLAIFVGVPVVSSGNVWGGGSSTSLSEKAASACYAAYVDRYADLADAYKRRSRGLTKAEWGKEHYTKMGKSAGRKLPGRCNKKARPILAGSLQSSPEYLSFVDSLSQIELSERPNIYILIFDSLIPKEVAALFFGDGSASYYGLLDEEFVIPQGVTLQDHIPSKASIRSVMWLDMIREQRFKKEARNGEFPGRIDSPLANIFRSNDYSISTGFHREFWGKPGEFVDQWVSPPQVFENTMLCIEPDISLLDSLKGFGICPLIGRYASIPSPAKLINDALSSSPKEDPRERWRQMVLDHIDQASRVTTPQLTFFYIFDPIGHTWKGFSFDKSEDLKKYREHFLQKSAEARTYLSQIISKLRQQDPNAILLIGGDHGSFISLKSKDEGFLLVDKRAVAIALWKSAHRCTGDAEANGFSPNPKGYHTISTVLRSIISCLSADPNSVMRMPLVADVDEDRIYPSWEEFLSRNINEDIRVILKDAISD